MKCSSLTPVKKVTKTSMKKLIPKMPEITNGRPRSLCFLQCHPFNWRNVFDIQLLMVKESSRTPPNGRGSVKWPKMQDIIQVNLTVR